MSSKNIFGGIEGGATQSNIVLIDGCGNTLATSEGPSTNHWLVGIEECSKRIKSLVEKAKEKAGLNTSTILNGLGLCLSGCEQESTNEQLRHTLQEKYPALAEVIYIASDTVGSLSTLCRNGGAILISGTGSNSLLMNPDGKIYHCGGWGHLLGDEGGAYWIASRAIKLLFDEDDCLIEPLFPTSTLRSLVYEHFHLKDRFDILPFCYSNFKKDRIASLTIHISRAATDGDETCVQLMSDSGHALGRHLCALSRNIDPALFDDEKGLRVVCAGSVFKSWPLLEEGFIRGVSALGPHDKCIPKYTLLRIKVTSAYGAAYKAAHKFGVEIPVDYDVNGNTFFHKSST